MNRDKKINNKRNRGLVGGFIALLGALLLLVNSASAQTYVGVRAGTGMGSARFLPAEEMGSVLGLFSGGISAKYFSDMKFVGAVQVDLQYAQTGYKYDLLKDSDSSYMRTINSIELPIMWHPHLYIMNRKARVFMNLGLTLNYNINSYEKYTSKENGVYSEGDYEFILVRDNRWGYGLVGGVGIGIFHKRFEFVAEGRYYYGYSDILKNYTKYPDNPMRSPMDNINISVAAYYRFGGEIKAEPSKRMAQKLEQMALGKQEVEQQIEDIKNTPILKEEAQALDSLELETIQLIKGQDDN